MSHPKEENTGLFRSKTTTALAQESLPYEGRPSEGGESGRTAASCCSRD